MWRILKAEFEENWYVLLIPYFVVLLPIIINISKGWPTAEFDLRGIKAMMAVGIAIVILVKIPRLIKDQKDRFHSLLPLSRNTIAVSRLLFPLIIWLSFLCIFWLGTVTVKPYHTDLIIWEALSLSGFILIGSAMPLIYRDMKICFSRKYQKFVLPVFYLILPILGYTVFYLLFATKIPYFAFFDRIEPYQLKYAKISSSQFASFVFIILGLASTSLSIFLFRWRKSYLQ